MWYLEGQQIARDVNTKALVSIQAVAVMECLGEDGLPDSCSQLERM